MQKKSRICISKPDYSTKISTDEFLLVYIYIKIANRCLKSDVFVVFSLQHGPQWITRPLFNTFGDPCLSEFA